jgi:chromosome segregation ATPase
MKDVLATVDREASNLSSGISAVSDLVKHLESKVKDRGKTEDEKIKRKAQIEAEIAGLEKKKSLTESLIEEKKAHSEQTKSKTTDLSQAMADAKNECVEGSKELSRLERSIDEKKREVEKLKSELQSIKKKHDSDIGSLRKSHWEITSKLSSEEAKHKALRLLIKEKAVSFPELKMIETLREQPTTNMENLQTATQLKRNDIEALVKTLVKKSVLQYDSKAGEVKAIRPLEE